MKVRNNTGLVHKLAISVAALGLSFSALAVVPVVKTVPWVASNPLIPHDTWDGKLITLKGTANVEGAGYEYWWDFGDGSSTAIFGSVPSKYAIEAQHTYTGSAGQVFTARLYVREKATGDTGSKEYYVKIEDKTLSVEVNVAIDEGLWFLHKRQVRSTAGGIDYGTWVTSYGAGTAGYYAITPQNINAFEVNGHLESGSPDNPYTETVARGLKSLFTYLTSSAIGAQTLGNPDSNGNGYGIWAAQSGSQFYQGGIFIDAIIASGTPNAVTSTGVAPSGANPGVLGRTYAAIVQDMVDYYAHGQYDGTSGGLVLGGWRYSPNDFPDNSACQWAAIGMIPAERNWGLTVPSWVKTANVNWLVYSQDTTGADSGVFGYTSTSPIWGPYATTASGMVQMAMDGIGRGNAMWDRTETFMRNNFDNSLASGATGTIKRHQYGLFSFVKSMLLHDANGDGVAEPITLLAATTTKPTIDWYSAEASKGATSDGVARLLVNDQIALAGGGGYWYGKNYYSEQYPFETGQAIIMLRRTLFESGAPVAVAKANPNPVVVGQIVQLDGADSFHQDSSKVIDSWEWDTDNDGDYDDASGPFPTVSFPALGDYPIGLRVSDNASPEAFATASVVVKVTIPPIAPSADAGGPYVLCPQSKPWFLNASGSTNPDDGESEPGQPGDSIISYEWDLDGDGQYDDAVGVAPDVTAFFEGKGPGDYLIQVRVTDNTATSFPSSGFGNLGDTDSATVHVNREADDECECVDDLVARAKPGKVQLVWTHSGAHHYNIYRGTVHGGPYLKIGSTTSTYSTYLDTAGIVNGTKYYYVVRPANVVDQEECQSNEATAVVPLGRR